MGDSGRSIAVLDALSNVGVGLSIDDFGTGYSSLSYLKRLPIEEIKIDRSFVMQMHVDANDFMIVRATVDLGRNLGLRVVAEGVEDLATFDRLADFGCDEAQGYYISRAAVGGGVHPLDVGPEPRPRGHERARTTAGPTPRNAPPRDLSGPRRLHSLSGCPCRSATGAFGVVPGVGCRSRVAVQALIGSEPFERLLLAVPDRSRRRPRPARPSCSPASRPRWSCPILAVAPGPHEAEALVADVEAFLPGPARCCCPPGRRSRTSSSRPTPEIAARRAAAIRRLRAPDGPLVVVAPVLARRAGDRPDGGPGRADPGRAGRGGGARRARATAGRARVSPRGRR